MGLSFREVRKMGKAMKTQTKESEIVLTNPKIQQVKQTKIF